MNVGDGLPLWWRQSIDWTKEFAASTRVKNSLEKREYLTSKFSDLSHPKRENFSYK
jgi:hypothetical protein